MVTFFKSCYGCGAVIKYAGACTDKIPMCRECKLKKRKPKYVYVNMLGKALPKYEYGTYEKIKESKAWIEDRPRRIKILTGADAK